MNYLYAAEKVIIDIFCTNIYKRQLNFCEITIIWRIYLFIMVQSACHANIINLEDF